MNQKIKIIPEASHIHLSEEVFSYLLMQVPAGRLTRYQDMEAYLVNFEKETNIELDTLKKVHENGLSAFFEGDIR